MPLTDVARLEESIEIAAPAETVWELVRDPRHMARWSPQTQKSILRGDGEVGPGSRFLNINRKGLLIWPTRSTVVRFEPGREIAWRVKDNTAVWSLRLASTESGGTRLLQARETPEGISDISARVTDVFMGGQDRFSAALAQGMRQTLAAIKAEAEQR
ncbi:MAG: SRPBCC family protein [Marmoricola sp.]